MKAIIRFLLIYHAIELTSAMEQSLYKRIRLLLPNMTSNVYKNLKDLSKIECGTLCSIEPTNGCNSFVYSKKSQSCSLANLAASSGIPVTLYPDSDSYINMGKMLLRIQNQPLKTILYYSLLLYLKLEN